MNTAAYDSLSAAHSDRLMGLCILLAILIVGLACWLWVSWKLSRAERKAAAEFADLSRIARFTDMNRASHANNVQTRDGGESVNFSKAKAKP